MATWKKVIVSGSNISQLNNDSGYLTSATVVSRNAFATASFNGTNLLADSPSGSLNFVSSSGQGLTIAATAGTDTLTFGLAAIPNSSLANSAITIAGTSTSLGGSITAATILSGTGVFSGSAQITGLTNANLSGTAGITNANLLNSGSIIGNTVVNLGTTVTSLTGLTSVTSTAFSGSLFGTSSWATNATNATTATNANNVAVTDTTTGTGPYYLMFADGTTGNRAVRVDSTTLTFNATTNTLTATSSYANQALSASFASSAPYSGLTGVPSGIVSGSSLSSPSQGNVTLTTNGVAATTTSTGLTTSDSPSFVNLTLTGDLSVLGTTTTIQTNNLLVEDQFILVSSGSANNSTDGGIIVDRGTYAAGNIALGYDATSFRWGLQNGLSDTTNTVDLGAASGGVSGSFLAHVFTEAVHGATKPVTGEFAVAGAIYTATNEDIWIYS